MGVLDDFEVVAELEEVDFARRRRFLCTYRLRACIFALRFSRPAEDRERLR